VSKCVTLVRIYCLLDFTSTCPGVSRRVSSRSAPGSCLLLPRHLGRLNTKPTPLHAQPSTPGSYFYCFHAILAAPPYDWQSIQCKLIRVVEDLPPVSLSIMQP